MQKWSPSGTRLERTHWRDETITQRHREWGFDCPCTDVDFLLIEYHISEPVAIVEYKHYKAKFPNLQQPSYRALQRLAEKSELPLFLAFYWTDIWAFRVYPINELAKTHFETPENLTEREYVARLHRLRRLALSREMMQLLNNTRPPEE